MSTGGLKSGYSAALDPVAAAAELGEQLAAVQPRAITFFCSHRHDGAALSASLRQRFPDAEVIGCTSAGEFTESRNGVNGVSAMGFGPQVLKRCAGALVRAGEGAEAGVKKAAESLTRVFGDLRALSPDRFVGVVLVEGLKMKEEEINEALGNLAPLISFVGGSAGDNLEFKQTRVFYNGEQTDDGAALLLIEPAVPFKVTKSCSFRPTGKSWKVTRADVATRTIYELDGRPIAEVYAEALGGSPQALDGTVFMANPLGLVIDDKPWIRSPQQLLPDGGLRFYCQVLPGMEIHLMQSTDLVKETHQALAAATTELGGNLRGGLAFNCILRRLELDAKDLHGTFYQGFRGSQTAGFHTYGESWLGHINQTLTALLFG
ncbi:MAG: FIST C-terminal domain-containing protein [Myxococcota bacterium]|nr:FIST C-terminal domain-containing protein [Myxococcota bacterium]